MLKITQRLCARPRRIILDATTFPGGNHNRGKRILKISIETQTKTSNLLQYKRWPCLFCLWYLPLRPDPPRNDWPALGQPGPPVRHFYWQDPSRLLARFLSSIGLAALRRTGPCRSMSLPCWIVPCQSGSCRHVSLDIATFLIEC